MKIQAAEAGQTFAELLGHLSLQGFAEAEVAMIFPPDTGQSADPDDATLVLGGRLPRLDVEEIANDESSTDGTDPETVAGSPPEPAATATQPSDGATDGASKAKPTDSASGNKPTASEAAKPASELDELMEKGISKVGDNHYKMTRALVNKILANPMTAGRQARVVPSIKNGQPDGFKLYAIRRGSIFARLGFENGDLIRSVNGKPLTTPDKALEAYVALKDAKRIEVAIGRNDQPMSLLIEIE